jgi:hypothetical protein
MPHASLAAHMANLGPIVLDIGSRPPRKLAAKEISRHHTSTFAGA